MEPKTLHIIELIKKETRCSILFLDVVIECDIYTNIVISVVISVIQNIANFSDTLTRLHLWMFQFQETQYIPTVKHSLTRKSNSRVVNSTKRTYHCGDFPYFANLLVAFWLLIHSLLLLQQVRPTSRAHCKWLVSCVPVWNVRTKGLFRADQANIQSCLNEKEKMNREVNEWNWNNVR